MRCSTAPEPLGPGERRRGLVAVERAAVLAGERLEIADRLVERGRIVVAERERLAERRERLGVRVEVARLLARAPVGGRGFAVAAGEPQMVRDRAGVARRRERRRRGRAAAAAVRRSSARTRPAGPVRGGTRARRAPLSARRPRRVSSSRAVTVSSSLRPLTARIRSGSNGRPSTAARRDDLPGDLAHAGHARLEQTAHARRQRPVGGAVRLRVEVLDDEERQPLRLLVQALGELGGRSGRRRELGDVVPVEPFEDDDVGRVRRGSRRRGCGEPGGPAASLPSAR